MRILDFIISLNNPKSEQILIYCLMPYLGLQLHFIDTIIQY